MSWRTRADGLTIQDRMTQDPQDLVEYFTETGPDYGIWSKHFNMHFGYYRRGMDPLNLERMLDQMNREVIQLLALDSSSRQLILDMGCVWDHCRAVADPACN